MTQLVKCPHCKALIEDDCCFCDQCGKQLMRCTQCGAFAKSKMCTKCGSPTKEATRNDLIGAHRTQLPTDNITMKDVKPADNYNIGDALQPRHIECRSHGKLRLLLSNGAIIGRRGSYGDIMAQFHSISGRHACLHLDADGGWMLEDIGSSYGTFVNGKRLDVNVPVKIKIGDMLRFANVDFEVVE